MDPQPPSVPISPRQDAVLRAVKELELHVAASGWDGPWRLFALVRTLPALQADPGLADRLPADVVQAARADPEHLLAVEQEDLPDAETIEEMLGQIVWPSTVDGAALVVERIVVPPEVEQDLPGDPQQALDWLAAHPARRDLRLAAAVLRDGTNGCAVRARDHDEDDRVALQPDLVPGIVSALAATLATTP